jgi:hypothetical protein
MEDVSITDEGCFDGSVSEANLAWLRRLAYKLAEIELQIFAGKI